MCLCVCMCACVCVLMPFLTNESPHTCCAVGCRVLWRKRSDKRENGVTKPLQQWLQRLFLVVLVTHYTNAPACRMKGRKEVEYESQVHWRGRWTQTPPHTHSLTHTRCLSVSVSVSVSVFLSVSVSVSVSLSLSRVLTCQWRSWRQT